MQKFCFKLNNKTLGKIIKHICAFSFVEDEHTTKERTVPSWGKCVSQSRSKEKSRISLEVRTNTTQTL